LFLHQTVLEAFEAAEEGDDRREVLFLKFGRADLQDDLLHPLEAVNLLQQELLDLQAHTLVNSSECQPSDQIPRALVCELLPSHVEESSEDPR